MNSTVLDSYLLFHRNDGEPRITQDDNTGGGPTGKNAQITSQLTNSGIFIIICTPLDPNVTGDYSVLLNKLSGLSLDDGVNDLSRRLFKLPERH